MTNDVEVLAAVEQFADYIQAETLAVASSSGRSPESNRKRSRSARPRCSFIVKVVSA